MLKIIPFILFFFPCLSFAQPDPEAAIAETARKLTGRWIEEYYEKDSVRHVQKVTGDNVFWETYVNGQLKESRLKEEKGYDGIDLFFTREGKGMFNSFTNYPLKKTQGEITELDYPTCQPAPKLIMYNGEVVVYMIALGGETIKRIIELTDNKLVWEGDTGGGYKHVFRKVQH